MRFLFVSILTLFVSGVLVPAISGEENFSGKTIMDYDCRSDGVEINWSTIRSDSDFSACLFQIARILENPENLTEWLKERGFSNVGSVSNTPNRLYLNAVWDFEVSGSRIPFAPNLPTFERWLTKGKNYYVQVAYDGLIPIYVSSHHKLK